MSFGSDRSVKLTVAASMDGFVNELAQGERAGQRFSKSIASSAKQAAVGLAAVKNEAKEVAVPLLAIGTVAAAGVAYAIKSYADFDEKMSSVKSLSHATADEQRQLKQAALETGTAIGFSATQAADAEIELVKAGVSANQIYGGALAGSLKLAAAGQIDVADATSIAASTLTQFNLKGRDVSHVADLLAAGADKALGGVSELGEGLKYIGPVAASAHVGLEQTVGSLALLAQNGILGEQAGTSLRGMLLSLTAPSQLASKVMQKYGIEVYNARGKFVGFNGVAEQLHTKLGTLDDATRDLALGQIFGNAQITAATILMNGGAKAVDKWTNAVNEQGFATEQAVGKMDNLNGDLTKLHASFQTAAIVTGEAADGPLRAAVQVVTDMISTYNQAPGAVQGVVLGVTALTAVVTLGSGAMLIAIPKVVAYGEALQVLSRSSIPGVSKAAGGLITSAKGVAGALGSAASFLTGPWGLALGAGAAGVALLNTELDKLKASSGEIENTLITAKKAADIYKTIGQGRYEAPWLDDVKTQFQDLDKVLSDFSKHNSGNFFEAIGTRFASPDNFQSINALRDLNEEMGKLQNADPSAGVRAFKLLADQTDGSAASIHRLVDAIGGDYRDALVNQANALGITTSDTHLAQLAMGEYAKAAKDAKNPTEENAQALDQLQGSAEDAAQSIEDTSNALKGLTSPTLDAREAQRQLEAAVDAVSDSVKKNGTTLDIGTEKGRANQAALDGIAQSAENAAGALYTQTGSQDQATAALEQGRESLIKALGQYGITGDAAQAYADKIIGTPTEWATLFEADTGTATDKVNQHKSNLESVPKKTSTELKAEIETAKKHVQDLKNRYSEVPTSKRTALQAEIAEASKRVAALKAQYDALHDKTVTVTLVGIDKTTNTARAAAGHGITRASGGPVYGPGTGTSDDIPVWMSNGEWAIRERSASMYGHRIMSAINDGLISKSTLEAAMSGVGAISKRAVVQAVATSAHLGAAAHASGGQITRASYAAPSRPVVVVQAESSGRGPLIGSVVQQLPANANPSTYTDSLMLALRRQERGG